MVIHIYQHHKLFNTRDAVRLQTHSCELDGAMMNLGELLRVQSPVKGLVCIKLESLRKKPQKLQVMFTYIQPFRSQSNQVICGNLCSVQVLQEKNP